MSKKRTVIESIVVCLFFLLIFILTMLGVFLASTERTEDELNNTLVIAEQLFDSNDVEGSKEQLAVFEDTTVRVSVITRTNDGYEIEYDSWGQYLSEGNAIELEADNIGKTVTRESSYGYDMVYLVSLNKENPVYYIRVAISVSDATSLTLNFLIYGTIILVIIIAGYVVYKVYDYSHQMKPLKNEIQRLAYSAGLDSNTFNNDDLTMLEESIDAVSDEIARKISDLEVETEKTNLILDSIMQGFFAVSTSGKILLFNKAAGEIFAYSQEEAVGKDYHILLLGEVFDSKIDDIIKGHEDVEPFDITKDGHIYRIDAVSLTYSVNSEGGAAFLIRDVTDERNTQKIKTDFFTNASHELKTPLTSILCNLEMLHDGLFDTEEEKSEAIGNTIVQAKKMRSLLADMITVSRLENGESVNREEINVEDSIASAVSTNQVYAKTKNITIETYTEPTTVVADRRDIDRLVNDLVDNAVKYGKIDGHVWIALKDGILSVRDDGIGIAEDNISRIFERFYRVDNSKGENSIEGTGLGLSIVKHICLRYGYKVEVESQLSEGSTFTITLR